MASDQHLRTIIDAIYGAVSGEDAEGWNTVARMIENTVGGVCKVSLEDPLASVAHLSAAPSIDPAFRDSYAKHYVKLNPWLQSALRRPPQGVVTGDELVPPDDLVRTPYYIEWLAPQGLRHSIGMEMFRDGLRAMAVGIMLPPDEPVTDHHRRAFKALHPHLRRAGQIHRQLSGARAAQGAAEAALDRLPVGLFLIDGDSRVTFHNAPARALVSAGDGLTLDADRVLGTAISVEAGHLRRLIRDAVLTSLGHGTVPGGAMRVTRPSGAGDLHVLVTPLHMRSPGLTDEATAAVFVSDPSATRAVSVARVADLLGLTRAEARVAASVASGLSVAETAERLGLARTTVRHHLKYAFLKTGTHRQADLVRLILADPLTYDRSPSGSDV